MEHSCGHHQNKKLPQRCHPPFRSHLVILKPDRTFMGSREQERNRFFTGFVDGKDKGIQVSKDAKVCSPRCCALSLVSFFLLSLGLTLGIYFGFKMVENIFKKIDLSNEKVFKGMFFITHGDVYDSGLEDMTSELYKNKALFYENRINVIFENSVLRPIFIKSEVTSFEPDTINSTSNILTVRFNLYFHPNKTNFDSGDVYIVMQSELENHGHDIFNRIKIDQSSIQILESLDDVIVAETTTTTTTTTTQSPILIESKIDKILPRIDHSTDDIKQCVPVASNFCLDVYYNSTTFPNIFGHVTRYQVDDFARQQFSRLINSKCYAYLKHFLCSLLQPSCHFEKLLLPCREFCRAFLSRCHAFIPFSLSRILRCNNLPSVESNPRRCLPEPDCSTFLRHRNHGDWICDDVNDCRDFSDENKCNRCKREDFYCGQNICISRLQLCDNFVDCPNGVDEKNCLYLVNSSTTALVTSTFSSGFLVLRDRGTVAKVCVDTLNYTAVSNRKYVVLNNIGRTTCELLNFKKMKFVRTVPDVEKANFYFHVEDPLSTRVTFKKAPCQSNHVIYIGCSQFVCGRLSVTHFPSNYTTSRRKLGPAAWPWHVSLFRDNVHVCDATLLSSQWILTSQACFQGQPKAHWIARIGTSRHLTVSLSEQQSRVTAMTHSPVEGSTLTLVKLHNPINFTATARPACIASKENLTSDGRKCVALSWDRKGEQLYEKQVVILKSGECEMSRNSVCAANLFDDFTCEDEEITGSPLLCPDGDSWNVVGVLNWRVGCGTARRPMTYDKVVPNAKWIKTVLGLS